MRSTFINQLLKFLRIKGISGGLEISDTALRFSTQSGNSWLFFSEKIAPGVMVDGRIMNPASFKEALERLRDQIIGKRKRDVQIQTIVSLVSAHAHMQTFSLPMLEGDELEKAIELNLQIGSPVGKEYSYAGWHIIGKDEKASKLEVLGSFIERGIVDAMIAPLREAGFSVGAIEPYPLSLVRAAREFGKGFDASRSNLLLEVRSNGIYYIITRNGELHFSYLIQWKEIKGDAMEIPWDVFAGALRENTRKVVAFHGSHWSGNIETAWVISDANFFEGIAKLLGEFGLSAKPLQFADDMEGEWLGALGSATRSRKSLRLDNGLSLLGTTAKEEFRRQQVLRFMSFWRITFPACLLILLCFSYVTKYLVAKTMNDAELQSNVISSSAENQELRGLMARAESFNSLVRAVGEVSKSSRRNAPTLDSINSFFAANGVAISYLSVDENGSVFLKGKTASEEKIMLLVEAMRNAGIYSSVNLPLNEISTNDQGSFFSISFKIISSETP